MVAKHIKAADRTTHVQKGQISQNADHCQASRAHVDIGGELASRLGLGENSVEQCSIRTRDFDQSFLTFGRQMTALVHLNRDIVGMVMQLTRFPRNQSMNAGRKIRSGLDRPFRRPQRTLQPRRTDFFERRFLGHQMEIQATSLHPQPLGNVAHPCAMISLGSKDGGRSIENVLAAGIARRFSDHRSSQYHHSWRVSNTCLTSYLTAVRLGK